MCTLDIKIQPRNSWIRIIVYPIITPLLFKKISLQIQKNILFYKPLCMYMYLVYARNGNISLSECKPRPFIFWYHLPPQQNMESYTNILSDTVVTKWNHTPTYSIRGSECNKAFPCFLHEDLVKLDTQWQFWNLLVMRIPTLTLTFEFDAALTEKFKVEDKAQFPKCQ